MRKQEDTIDEVPTSVIHIQCACRPKISFLACQYVYYTGSPQVFYTTVHIGYMAIGYKAKSGQYRAMVVRGQRSQKKVCCKVCDLYIV